MNKEELTILALKLIGICLIIIYGSSFVVQIVQVVTILRKEDGGAILGGYYTWQGFVGVLLPSLAGMVLIWKAKKIASLL